MSLLYAANPATSQSNPITGLIPIVLIVAIFYFLIIRPQQKKMKDHQKKVSELQKGDKIVTSGGIYGTIESFREDKTAVYVTIADNIKVLVDINSIANIIK